jgi:D-alanyl-D-alanine carboxypeptidase (penicillin-binding protein 5/6)
VRRPIASLTKIMTALLVLESTPLDERVTVSPRAAAELGSELGLIAGERRTVEDLLYGLLLQSSNDAAIALAEHVAGTVERFVARMNRRAGRLGMRRTTFASPNGLADLGRSTAHDLAILTAAAYDDPVFVRIVRTRRRVIPAPTGPPRRIQSRNALLWLYPGAVGVKTGYTAAAGFCIVGAADRGHRRLAAVVLGAPGQAWDDAASLLDFGFHNWKREVLVDAGTPLDPGRPVRVRGIEVPVKAGGAIVALARPGADARLRVQPDADLSLPVYEGARVGTVTGNVDGELVGRVPLLAAATVRISGGGGVSPDPGLPEIGEALWRLLRGLLDAIF